MTEITAAVAGADHIGGMGICTVICVIACVTRMATRTVTAYSYCMVITGTALQAAVGVMTVVTTAACIMRLAGCGKR